MEKTNFKRKKTFIIKKSKVVLSLVQSLENKHHGSVIYAKDDEPELVKLHAMLSSGYHHKRSITMEDRRILKEHQAGMNQISIAEKHHCSTCKVYNSLTKFGVHCGKTHAQAMFDSMPRKLSQQ